MDIRRIDTGSAGYIPRLEGKRAEKPQGESAPAQDSVQLGNQQQQPEQTVPKKWTIMHYTAADNNLTSFMVADVNEMESVGSTANMNIIAQVDQGGSNCKRYFITKDNDMSRINSPVLKDLGSTNMADPQVMADFLKETMEKYPAEHYAFIISDHGYAWKGAVEDVSHHGWMTMPMIREGIEKGLEGTGKKLDVVGFDACLMATSEVAYELKDVANYLVASEQTEGGAGWPYTPLLTKKNLETFDRALRMKLDIPPDEFAKKIVDTAQAAQGDLPTMSAMDLNKMDGLAKATNSFSQAIIDTSTPNRVLQDIARKTQSFYGFKDQYHFAQQVVESKQVTDMNLKETAKELMNSIKDAVIREQHSSRYPNAHGLTAEIPTSGTVGKGYGDLKYAQDTLWDEAMNKMNS